MTKTLVSLNEKCISEHYREVQTRKNIFIDIIFAMKKKFHDLFRGALYRLILVLHKDALFHSNGWFPALPPSIKLGSGSD
jgi:hypothetical protein